MLLSLFLFENELINLIAISFTSLIFVELIMVGLSISTW
jgi:phospholipid-translocating ATPase